MIVELPPGHSLLLNFDRISFDFPSTLFIDKDQFVSCEALSELNFYKLDKPEISAQYPYLFDRVLTVGSIRTDLSIQNTTNLSLDHYNQLWLDYNPFNTSREELQQLFLANQKMEQSLHASLKPDDISKNIDWLVRPILGVSFQQWKTKKLISKAKKRLYQTAHIKEVVNDLGFKDISYFGRFFKKITTQTPGEFLKTYERAIPAAEVIIAFEKLLHQHLEEVHHVSFYADQMGLSESTFLRQIVACTHRTPKQLIHERLVQKTKHKLALGMTVTETAFSSGFQEVAHFSNFFRKMTGQTPLQYQQLGAKT